MKILLIDDSYEMGLVIKQCLIPLEVTQSLTLKDARTVIETTRFDLVLIDVSLPDGDGFSFCSELSAHPLYTSTPFIMLTAKDNIADKVFGLNCGACDYITKPFFIPELKARIHAHLRHYQLLKNSTLKTKYFELDTNLQKCYILNKNQKKDAVLTPTEFKLLFNLYKNKNVPMSREEIIRSVWSTQGTTIEQKGLDTHIAHLRKKMGALAPMVISVYGIGYVFEES